MTLIFKLNPFNLSWLGRVRRMYPFQGLDTRFFIHANDMNPLFIQLFSLMIDFANRSHVFTKLCLILDFMIQPIARPMRLYLTLSPKTPNGGTRYLFNNAAFYRVFT
jgi:hypothetical protein